MWGYRRCDHPSFDGHAAARSKINDARTKSPPIERRTGDPDFVAYDMIVFADGLYGSPRRLVVNYGPRNRAQPRKVATT